MNDTRFANGGFSTDVRMHLSVNGHVFLVGQLGPDFLILDDPIDHPPAEAEIRLSIDGRAREWSVDLPDGIIAGKPETRIVRRLSGSNGPTAG